jgi:peptide/nickel transport system substrate-binding protein
MGLRRAAFILSAIAYLSSVFLVSGCAPPVQTVTSVRLAYPHELVTLDPHAHSDLVTRTVLEAVYEGVVRFEPGLPVQPWLADRWTTPDDNTWKLHIREDVRFHDGRWLTPADVVASIERARTSGVLGRELEEIASVREMEGEERIVEITTREPSPLLLAQLEVVAIVPRDFEPSVPIGTGPYQWRVGSLRGPVLLDRWPDYWGQKPDFDEASLQFVAASDDLASLIHQGRLDVVAAVTVSYAVDHEQFETWRLVARPGVVTTFLALNVSAAPLDDSRVRRAIDLAVDRRALVEAVYPQGMARAAESLVPPEVFGFNGAGISTRGNVEESRLLIAEAEIAEEISLEFEHSGAYAPLVEYLVASLAEVGLDVEPVSFPYENFYRRIEDASNHLYLFSWSFRIPDASPFLDAIVHSRKPLLGLGRFNGTSFSDHEVDMMIEQAAHGSLSARRHDLLRETLARVSEADVYLPLFQPSNLALVRGPFKLGESTRPLARPQDVHIAP